MNIKARCMSLIFAILIPALIESCKEVAKEDLAKVTAEALSTSDSPKATVTTVLTMPEDFTLVDLVRNPLDHHIYFVAIGPGRSRFIYKLESNGKYSIFLGCKRFEENVDYMDPLAISVDPNGTFYLSGRDIRVSTYSKGLLATVSPDTSFKPIPETVGNVYYPQQTTVTDDGTVFIAEGQTNRISKLTSTGELSIVAGSSRNRPPFQVGDQDGPALQARFFNPSGLVRDSDGTLYVSDANRKIKKISPEGFVSTLTGSTYGGDAGKPFPYVSFLTVGPDHFLYTADVVNSTILRISPKTGDAVTIAGSEWEDRERTGTSPKAKSPAGLIWADGALYVLDRVDNKIKKINFKQ